MFVSLLKRPIILIFSSLLILLAGISSLKLLPVNLFPNLNYPLINVITHYPAGTAQDMEQLITRPIETAMMGLNELQRVRSTSAPGFSQVTVEFNWGVGAEQARQRVFSRLAQITSQLPRNAHPELENIGSSLSMLSTYILQSADPIALQSWVKYQLAPRLSSIAGIVRVHVMGGGKRTWRVDIVPLKLKQSGVNILSISQAIRHANVLNTGGFIAKQGRDLLIRTDGRLLSIADLKKVVVGTNKAGLPITLTDVANIYEGKKPQRYAISKNGLSAVALTIQKQPNASSLTVSSRVDKVLKNLTLPQGVTITKFYDQAEIIGVTYRNMRDHLFSGTLLAILAVFFILGRNKASLVIAVTFPLTVLATFWAMHIFDLGLNLMTLGALTVAIGMVADDAMIVLENIDRHRQLCHSPWQAVLTGTKEIFSADVTGTLTILAAFAPLILVGGLAGRLFHPFGMTFSLLLLFSLLISLTLIPLAALHWMQPSTSKIISKPGIKVTLPLGARCINALTSINLKLLDRLMLHRKITLVVTGIMLVVSSVLLVFNPIRFLPLLDENSLLMSYQLAPGTSLKESIREGEGLSRQILTMPYVQSVFRRTGSPQASFYLEGTNQGELVVRLLQKKPKNAANIVKLHLEELLAKSPGIIGTVREPTSEKLDESFSGLPTLFGISVFGTHIDELYAATKRVEQAARQTDGITNIVNNTKVPVDQLLIRLNASQLALRHVVASDAAKAIKQAMQGETVTNVIKNQQAIGIYVRLQASSRQQISDLQKLLIPNDQGKNIPLRQIASITHTASHPSIEHQRGLRSLTLSAEIEGNPFTVIQQLNKNIAKLKLANNIQVAYTGEYPQLLTTGSQMLVTILAAIILVYALITLQLGNLIDPLVVLVKLPLDFFGAAIALFITHQALDLTILIGFITLIGVATNNGIMLLTFTRNLRRQGMNALDAVREAARLRTRPMLLTHTTTLLALIPAAIGLGVGPQLLQPLSIMLFGGLTIGTLFTLNILPVIYVSTERWRKVNQANK